MKELSLVVAPLDYRLYGSARRAPLLLGTATDGSALRSLLAQHCCSRSCLSIYTDLAEESYVRTDVPRLWSAAMRRQLLQRRLRQHFPDHPYTAAMLFGRRLQVLPQAGAATLLALADVPQIQEAVSCIQAGGHQIRGMWPLALGLARVGGRGTYLLTARLPYGLRHVFVQDGMALFSRLSVMPAKGGPLEWLADATRTAQFLHSQGWIHDARLETRILHPEALTHTPAPAAGILDVTQWRCETDLYALAVAASQKDSGQLLPPDATLGYRAAAFGRAVLALSLTCLGLAFGWLAAMEWQVHGIQAIARAAQQQIHIAGSETARILAGAQGDLSQAGLAQAAVRSWQQIVESQPDYSAVLEELPRIFALSPQFQLTHMSWRSGSLGRTGEPGGTAAAKLLPDQPLLCDSAPSAASGAAGVAPASASLSNGSSAGTLTLKLVGQLPPGTSLREQMDAQLRIESALRREGWQVHVLRPAVDLGSTAVSSGMLGQAAQAALELCITVSPSSNSNLIQGQLNGKGAKQ